MAGWVVVAKEPDGTKHRILCDGPTQVADHFNEQRKMGRTVTIEEASGKEVTAAEFGVKDNLA